MKPLRSLQALIASFEKLPGVGFKSAERMAQAVLDFSDEDVMQFQQSLLDVKQRVKPCQICGVLTEDNPCEICTSSRPHQTLVIVSYSKDVLAFEKLEAVNFRYHVLGGVLSASKGFTVRDLHIESIQKRLKDHSYEEVILATNPTLEGETTAQLLANQLQKEGLTITRLGYGLPMGGHVDYADALTLSKAIGGRTNIKGDK
ncbi:MAG: recombination mediator RecR [Bacilli bacterium]